MKTLSSQQATRILRALAHPMRLELLGQLSREEQCVCHLTALSRKRQAYVSQQLAALRRAGVVRMRKEGLRVYYRVNDPRVRAILKSLCTRSRHRGSRATIKGCDCPNCNGKPRRQNHGKTRASH